MVLAGEIKSSEIRFFAGYSGWGPGQLVEEIEEGSWILTTAPTEIILSTESDQLWRTLLRRMGGPFALLSNFPTDPRRN
jgi:putative transcriptional regulator